MRKHTAQITSKSIEQSGLPADFKKSIAEYIWNGFDANASVIELNFDANEVGYINNFSISDNGTGIDLSNITETFGHFLDSKKVASYDQTGFIKGKAGKGRYSFTNFSNQAVWETTYQSENNFLKYNITINKGQLQDYQTSDNVISLTKNTGTIVHFKNFHSLTSDLLESEEFINYLASEFGWFLFLNKEHDYKILINGEDVDYWTVIGDFKEMDTEIGKNKFEICYIRWSKNIGDKYYYYFLNNEKIEVERKHTSFNNKAVDFHHSIFIISDYFNDFKFTKIDDQTLGFGTNQSDPIYKKLMSLLNDFISQQEKLFIRDQKAEKLIEHYNEKKIFPTFNNNTYEQLRKKDLENVVKEIYCIQPKIFQGLKITQSKTLVGFLNLLLDTEQRENILEILQDIVDLSTEEKIELSSILKKTKISSIASLVNLLESRFETIQILNTLVFELQKFTTERDHIQKVIENNYWLFGEQYHLVSADKNLEVLLNNYLNFIETDKKEKTKLTSKDKLKRPDIFVARQIENPDPNSDEYSIEENIIVELKRPSIIIGKKQYDQVEEYIRFIINEPQFNSELRKWKLILIGKKVDEWIKDKYDSNKSKGKRFLVEAVRNYEIFAMTWDDLFKTFDIRHKHLIDKLEFKNSIVESLAQKGIVLDLNNPIDFLNKVAEN